MNWLEILPYNVMTRARFWAITQNSHFENSEIQNKNDKAAQIHTLLDHFIRKSQIQWKPEYKWAYVQIQKKIKYESIH